MADLSVLIPARNERWLSRTVDDVIAHAKGDTEVIVVLDGAWPEAGYELHQHPRVNVIYLPQPIGQRAATNLAASVSTAKYVMKLDGHVSLADNFDVVLMDAARELGPACTQIPAGTNLHVYDRICDKCGKREYQGSPTAPCIMCGETTWTLDVKWRPRRGTTKAHWSFTSEPKFQYGGAKEQPSVNGIHDVMSSLGACFFMEREQFWRLGGLDVKHGSWGSFGIEIACKSWLSGGRHVCNTNTSFSHLFRVGGLGFPYPISGVDQEKAKAYSRDLWFNNKWSGQVKPLRWLVEKFWPVSGWTAEDLDALPTFGKAPAVKTKRTKGVVYYTDNQCPEPIASSVREQLASVAPGPIVSVSLKPIAFGQNITLPLERGYLTMFRQILAGLEALDTDTVFLAEHDVLYSPSHFQYDPLRDDRYYFNQHVWKVDASTGRALHYRCSQTSGLCANRKLLIEHYRKRVAVVERNGFTRAMGFEPGTHNRLERVDDFKAETWMSAVPNVDIRHTHNLTPSRWKKEQFRNQKYCEGWTEADEIPGWGVTRGRFAEFLQEVAGAQQAVA